MQRLPQHHQQYRAGLRERSLTGFGSDTCGYRLCADGALCADGVAWAVAATTRATCRTGARTATPTATPTATEAAR